MVTEAQTCALVAINNASRPGLNRLYTKYYRLTTNCPLHLSRVLYKSTLFMQNKPNLLNAQMNVSSAITMNYEQLTMNYANKNKPNSNPIQTQNKPNCRKGIIDAKCVFTKDYEEKCG